MEVRKITQKYSALVVGSDGIFEFFKNYKNELADIIWEDRNKPAYEVAQTIVNKAVERWKENENGVDDCT